MRILLVDDDPFVLELLKDALEISGYDDVTAFDRPRDVLEDLNATDRPYDCMLVDIQMPEMDGVQLVREIRSLPGYRETPIVMVTAMADRSYVNTAFMAGANDYITKPFDIDQLAQRMRALEEQEEARRAARTTKAPIALGASEKQYVARETVENYLKQLARSGAPHSVVAFRIGGGALSEDEWVTAREAVVRVFSRLLADEAYLATLGEDGTLVCIHQGEGHRFDPIFATSLREVFARCTAGSFGDRVTIEMGQTKRGYLFRQIDATRIVDAAIESIGSPAESRVGATDHMFVARLAG